MKKDFWKQLLQIIIAILTAISSTLFVQSCVKSNSLKKLTITTGAQDFVITPAEENSTFFAALPALTEQAVSFVAKGSNSHTYYAANPEFRDLTLAPIRIKLPFPFIL